MASLSLKHIYKVYDGTVKAVNDFSMEIEDKEFIVFVGPSGCGKSTTLRMIAGLEDITAGDLQIDGITVNDFEPKDRNIAMVFQNYALYPHMSVYDNLAFSLRTAKVPKDEIHEKVIEAANILGITEYLDRKPKALSGGQRQRVALGRAIVRNPKVFLLDEPLSNLDAKLRAAMRAEISRLHERLETTFIYVTHDQVEAMTMGTRIVVMRAGYVQQIDTPQNLYRYPKNMFVAGFIGTPQMNFFDGTVLKKGESVTVTLDCGCEISMDYHMINRVPLRYLDGEHRVVFGIRPDDVRLDDPILSDEDWEKTKAAVTAVEALGGETVVYANLNLEHTDSRNGAIVLRADAECDAAKGDVIDIAINKRKLHVFDKLTEESIKCRIPEMNVVNCKISSGIITFASQELMLPPALAKSKEGSAEMIIPTTAIHLGAGDAKATVERIESIDGKVLYQLNVAGTTLFCLVEGETHFIEGEQVRFSIDFDKITVADCGIAPLNTLNVLDGRFVRVQERDENGKKRYNFYMEIAGKKITSPEKISEKLFACKGTKIFDTPLQYIFSADSLKVIKSEEQPDGFLSGTITETYDYGEHSYCRINLGMNSVIASHSGKEGDKVVLELNTDRITVKDKAIDIIIV